jgi:hypothetical protein
LFLKTRYWDTNLRTLASIPLWFPFFLALTWLSITFIFYYHTLKNNQNKREKKKIDKEQNWRPWTYLVFFPFNGRWFTYWFSMSEFLILSFSK